MSILHRVDSDEYRTLANEVLLQDYRMSPSFVLYQQTYLASKPCNDEALLTYKILNSGTPIGVLLILFEPSSYRKGTIFFHIKNLSNISRTFSKKLIKDLSREKINLPVNDLSIFIDPIEQSSVYFALLSSGFEPSYQERIVYKYDKQNPKNLERDFRKSFKQLIRLAKKKFRYQVHEKIEWNEFLEFKNLHHRVSGRITRSDDTWNQQFRMINCGYAFLVTIRDDTNSLVGGSLFSVFKEQAHYFVGVYDRSLSDQPLGHGALATAIEFLSAKDVSILFLSEKYRQSNLDQKEFMINNFKIGFSNKIYLQSIFSI